MAETRDSSVSRDMLQRFTCGGGNSFPAKPKEEAHGHGRPENVELSLGLSLNGRFGAKPEKNVVDNDKNYNKKLFRASSVTDFMNFPVDVELSLARTCSLPPETEAEWWKRKELQSLRRSEAKRKRVEKLKNVRVVKVKSYEIELSGLGSKQSQPPPPQSPPAVQISSQGSVVSQGSGGSSGVSDMDSQPIQGINKDGSKVHESCASNNVECIAKIEPKVDGVNDDRMPCVSTKGEGPNGKRIQGFLYQYGKGEEVRIVCVCHGSFLTPAEFVKHGGGGDVEHPLRHIIVTSCSIGV